MAESRTEPGLPDITAIVVAHDSAAVLGECLASLAREGVSAIVVDNASTDDSIAIAERHGARVVRNARNQGFGRAMNIGMRAASTRFCLLTNPDLTFDEGAVVHLIGAARDYPRAMLLAPRIIEPDGRLFFQNRSLLSGFLKNEKGAPCVPEGDCCTPFLSGACLLLDLEAVLALGGFDPEIFLFYEDDDLCRRVSEAGHALVHVHGAVARHARGGSSAPRPGRVFKSRFHLAWSRLYVARKWHLREKPLAWVVRAALKLPFAALLGNKKRMERYAGTVSGALAFWRGESALAREGLDKQEIPGLREI